MGAEFLVKKKSASKNDSQDTVASTPPGCVEGYTMDCIKQKDGSYILAEPKFEGCNRIVPPDAVDLSLCAEKK